MARLAATALLVAMYRGHAQESFLPARQLAGSQDTAGANASVLACPIGFEQVGPLNADIQGCGLEECDARFLVPTLQACGHKCVVFGWGCKAFSWAPIGGDHYHMSHRVCTIYGSDKPNQVWGPKQILCKKSMPKCPPGWVPAGALNDIKGCGLEDCDTRYREPSPLECGRKCDTFPSCNAFSWAPVGGDRDHMSESVCTMYGSSEPNQQWGPVQIMCKRELQCPDGWVQVGGPNADISGCGLKSCSSRYGVPNLKACSMKCTWSGLGCKAFTWAPLGGDRQHMDKQVCTLYESDTPDQVWGPHQIMCKMA